MGLDRLEAGRLEITQMEESLYWHKVKSVFLQKFAVGPEDDPDLANSAAPGSRYLDYSDNFVAPEDEPSFSPEIFRKIYKNYPDSMPLHQQWMQSYQTAPTIRERRYQDANNIVSDVWGKPVGTDATAAQRTWSRPTPKMQIQKLMDSLQKMKSKYTATSPPRSAGMSPEIPVSNPGQSVLKSMGKWFGKPNSVNTPK
jgi:hypothetical protein